MSITPVLYIVLGISLGVGITLIYLQEKFVRERQKLLALAAAEKAKSQELLKELDAKWELETAEAKKELDEARQKHASLEEATLVSEKKIVELTQSIAEHDERADDVQVVESPDIEALKISLQEKDAELTALLKEKDELLGALAETRQEISELHGELDFLKGKITSLEGEREKAKPDEDFLVFTPGKHFLPGAVARKLMGKKSDE